MAAGDNIGINPGSGAQIAADVINRGEGNSLAQFIKILDATDGSVNFLVVDSTGAAKVTDQGVHTTAKNYALTLDTGAWTPVQTGGAILPNRLVVHLQNFSDVDMEVGFASTGALGSGTIIPAGQSMSLNFGTLPVYVQPVSGTAKRLNVIEAA